MDLRYFPDVNNFTGRFDVHQVRSAGALIVGILATDGTGFVSPTYAEQAAHAHEARLIVWHYHFARPEQDPAGVSEMGHFWRTARTRFKRGDRLVLDVERTHPQGSAALVTYIKRLDRTLHELSGIHEVPYMPDSLFRDCGPNLQTLANEFWMASWGGRVARLGHGRKMIAQQINDGVDGFEPTRYPGIGRVDMNLLQRWYTRRVLAERRKLHL